MKPRMDANKRESRSSILEKQESSPQRHKDTKRGMKKTFMSSSLRGEHLPLRAKGAESDQMKQKDMEIDHKDTKRRDEETL